MSLSWFKFGDIDTRDYGIVVSAVERYALPQRDYTEHQVPGRNGNIYADNGSYKNVPVKYHCEVPTQKWLGFGKQFEEFRKKLAETVGYQELRDSYDTKHVMKGILTGSVSPQSNGPAWIIGAFDIEFSCMPQRWVEETEIDVTISPVVVGVVESDTYELSNWSNGRRTGFIPIIGDKSCVIRTQPFSEAHCSVHGYNENGTHKTYKSVDIAAENGQHTFNFNAEDKVSKVRISFTTTSVSDSTTLDIISQGKLVQSVNKEGAILHNASGYDIYPVITLERTNVEMTGECYFYVGDYKFVVQPFSGTLVIDCEAQTVYDAEGNYGGKYLCIYDVDGGYAYEYPHLESGDTKIKTNDCTRHDVAKDPYFTIRIRGMGRTV